MLTTLLLLAFFALGTVCARGWFTKQRRLSSPSLLSASASSEREFPKPYSQIGTEYKIQSLTCDMMEKEYSARLGKYAPKLFSEVYKAFHVFKEPLSWRSLLKCLDEEPLLMDGKTVNLKEFVHIVPEDNLLDGLPKGSPRWNENSPCYKFVKAAFEYDEKNGAFGNSKAQIDKCSLMDIILWSGIEHEMREANVFSSLTAASDNGNKAYPLVLKHTLLSTLLTEFKLYWGKDENNDYMKEFKGCRKESGYSGQRMFKFWQMGSKMFLETALKHRGEKCTSKDNIIVYILAKKFNNRTVFYNWELPVLLGGVPLVAAPNIRLDFRFGASNIWKDESRSKFAMTEEEWRVERPTCSAIKLVLEKEMARIYAAKAPIEKASAVKVRYTCEDNCGSFFIDPAHKICTGCTGKTIEKCLPADINLLGWSDRVHQPTQFKSVMDGVEKELKNLGCFDRKDAKPGMCAKHASDVTCKYSPIGGKSPDALWGCYATDKSDKMPDIPAAAAAA